jgi:hypothetical protein
MEESERDLHFNVQPWNIPGGQRISTKTSVRIADFPVDNRTGDLPNSKQNARIVA